MNKPFISFAVIILSLGFIFWYVVPAYTLHQERQKDVAALSEILKNSGEIPKLIQSTKQNLSTIERSGLDRFEVFLPERIDPIRFANNIESMARKHRIILSDINIVEGSTAMTSTQPATAAQGLVRTLSLGAKMNEAQGVNKEVPSGSPAATSKYGITKATASFLASYETFQLFLNDLEKSLGVIDITSLTFSPASETKTASKSKGATTQYQFALTIQTYSLK